MKISRLLMPATTLAGALALAGCGGSDSPPPAAMNETTTCTGADGRTFKIPGKGADCPAVNPTPPDKESQQALIDARELRFKIGDAFERANANWFSAALNTGKTNSTSDQGTGFVGKGFKDADEDLRFLGELMASEGAEIGAGTITINATNKAKYAKADEFSKGSEKPHKANDRTKDPTIFTTSGSYRGVAGVFSCTPGTCTSKINNLGELELGGTWTFTATDPKSKFAPATIAEYGWWMTEDEGDLRDVAVFHRAIENVDPSNLGLDGFGGSAEYEGDAAGLYALNVGAGEENDHGSFTAKASLKADFVKDMLGGTIHTFKGDDGEDRDWKIELVKSSLSDAGKVGPSSGKEDESVKWTVGGDTDDTGRWDAQMYGEDDKEPDYVLGSFGALHDKTDGRIIGTFGAEHDE